MFVATVFFFNPYFFFLLGSKLREKLKSKYKCWAIGVGRRPPPLEVTLDTYADICNREGPGGQQLDQVEQPAPVVVKGQCTESGDLCAGANLINIEAALFEATTCSGATCTTEECCVQQCQRSLSTLCSGDFVNANDFSSKTCSSSTCTVQECCDPKGTCVNDNPACNEVSQTRIGAWATHTCLEKVCTADECCQEKDQCDVALCGANMTPLEGQPYCQGQCSEEAHGGCQVLKVLFANDVIFTRNKIVACGCPSN